MSYLLKNLSAVALSLFAATAFAVPKELITHNNTNVESKAFINNSVPPQHPAAAGQTSKIPWVSVRMACFPYAVNNICSAVVKMETNTNHPVDLGTLYLNLTTGDITPKSLSANGYTLTVIGPAETTLSKD